MDRFWVILVWDLVLGQIGSVWVERSGFEEKVESTVSELTFSKFDPLLVSKWGVYRCPSLSEVKRSETVAQG